ncbi:MAG TPA: CBS domain-containing protein [Candidatus Limnocylindrales bacterium]|nr:CBS domain-containing protein [Candidatus Limnocylindrales bacterium]
MHLIITHENGDFDALASAVAAAKLYPGSVIVMPEPLQPNVRSFVNLYRDLLPLIDPKEIDEIPDAVVVVDTRKNIRLGPLAYLLEQAKHITIYDHHPPGDDDMDGHLVKVEPVGATTTLLVEEIRSKDISLTNLESTLLVLGIYEDTGCLTYDLTTSRDAAAVAYLWTQGLCTSLIPEYLHSPLTDAQKGLLEKLIKSSELYEIQQRRVLISTIVMDEYVKGASVLMQLLDEIEDADLTMIIVQMTESIYLAARAQGSELNLLELLAPFGVKGHARAVSANYKAVEATLVKEQVISYLNRYLPPAEKAGQVASKPVFTVTGDVSVTKTAELLAEHNYRGCPVMEDGNLVGVISRRDLQKALHGGLGHAPVKGFMKRKVKLASPDASLVVLRRLMVEHNIGRIPLVNGDGTLVGIVTRSDILRHLDRLDKRGRFVVKPVTPDLSGIASEDMPLDEIDGNILPLMSKELPAEMQKLLLLIGQLAHRCGVRVYLVGGVIRDLLLKWPLPKDLDFVVIGDAILFAGTLQKTLGGDLKHFEQFGTASLFLKEGLRLDVVTARKEFYASPAALPQVESSSLKNDLFRRDFSINTMACSIMPENYGKLYDFYDGQPDIQKKTLRILYNLSFVDDPLRILRAIRFEQRYGFEIEPETLRLLGKAVKGGLLEKLSRQRLNHELKLIYEEPEPVKIMQRFEDLELFDFLYPRVQPTGETWARLIGIAEILNWARQREWEKPPDSEVAYLCGLMYDLESEDRSAIMRKLHLSRDRAAVVLAACREAPALLEELDRENISPSALVNCLEQLPLEALLLVYAMAEREKVKENLKHYLDGLQYIRPRLKGGDLKKIGLEPGPLYRTVLDRLKEAVLDGKVRTPQEEFEFVLEYLEMQKRGGG